MYEKTFVKFVFILFVFLLSLTYVSANDTGGFSDAIGADSLEYNGASSDIEVSELNEEDVLSSNAGSDGLSSGAGIDDLNEYVNSDSSIKNTNSLTNAGESGILAENEDLISNFTDLKKAIDESSTGIIILNGNVTRGSDEFSDEGFIIDRDVTVNGNGFTIDFSSGSFLKILSNGTLALNNITLLNLIGSPSPDGGAIYNEGGLTVENSNFVNGSNFLITNHGLLNLENSNFIYSDKFINYGSMHISNCSFIARFNSHDQFTYDIWGQAYKNYSDHFYDFHIINEKDLIIDNSSFTNFSHHLITSHDFLNISNSLFINNGAVISTTGICNIANTRIINSSAGYLDKGGGALANRGDCSIFNSTFENNTVWLHQFANGGGAIYNEGDLNITSNVFKNNYIDPFKFLYQSGGAAFTWFGNVIYNTGNLTANYNVFLNNTKLRKTYDENVVNDKYDIYNVGGDILACRYNWWGSNNPVFDNLTNFDVSSWLVMTADPTYSNLGLEESVVLSVYLNRLNDGNEVPDSSLIPVRQVIFNCSGGDAYLSSSVSDLSLGSASVVFSGSDVRSGFAVNASIDGYSFELVIDVDKFNSSLEFDCLDIVYGDNLTINVDVFDNGQSSVLLDGMVCVLIDGKEHRSSLNENGSCTFSIEGLSAGDYVLNVSYLGNEYFSRSFADKLINVDKLNTNITIIADDIIEGQKARIIINASPSDIGGFARIVINNKTYKVYLNHGSATYEVRNLNDGDYLVAVYYEGTDNYYNSSAITHFTVYRNITSKEDTFLSIFADNIIVGENQTVEILVGPGEVYGYGVLTINNNSFDFYVVNGSANVTLTDLALGDYVISASYNESYYYHASSNITSFSVVKKYNDSNFKMDVNLSLVRNGLGEVSVDFKPYTISGNLTVGVNEYYYLLPFSNGFTSFNISLVEGSNNLVIYYPGDEDFTYKLYNETFSLSWVYDTHISCSSLKVSAVPSAGVKSGEYLTGYLLDSSNNPLASKTIVISFGGSKYKVSTDSKGFFKFQVNIVSAGKYKFNLYFPGDSRFKSCSSIVGVSVLKNKVKFSSPTKKVKKSNSKRKFKIILKTVSKKVLKGRVVYLKINKKTYKAKTSSKGVAVFKLKLANKKKIYKYKATFKGDSGNYKKTFSGKLKVY